MWRWGLRWQWWSIRSGWGLRDSRDLIWLQEEAEELGPSWVVPRGLGWCSPWLDFFLERSFWRWGCPVNTHGRNVCPPLYLVGLVQLIPEKWEDEDVRMLFGGWRASSSRHQILKFGRGWLRYAPVESMLSSLDLDDANCNCHAVWHVVGWRCW